MFVVIDVFKFVDIIGARKGVLCRVEGQRGANFSRLVGELAPRGGREQGTGLVSPWVCKLSFANVSKVDNKSMCSIAHFGRWPTVRVSPTSEPIGYLDRATEWG